MIYNNVRTPEMKLKNRSEIKNNDARLFVNHFLTLFVNNDVDFIAKQLRVANSEKKTLDREGLNMNYEYKLLTSERRM